MSTQDHEVVVVVHVHPVGVDIPLDLSQLPPAGTTTTLGQLRQAFSVETGIAEPCLRWYAGGRALLDLSAPAATWPRLVLVIEEPPLSTPELEPQSSARVSLARRLPPELLRVVLSYAAAVDATALAALRSVCRQWCLTCQHLTQVLRPGPRVMARSASQRGLAPLAGASEVLLVPWVRGFGALTELDLSCWRCLTDDVLCQLSGATPLLRKLDVSFTASLRALTPLRLPALRWLNLNRADTLSHGPLRAGVPCLEQVLYTAAAATTTTPAAALTASLAAEFPREALRPVINVSVRTVTGVTLVARGLPLDLPVAALKRKLAAQLALATTASFSLIYRNELLPGGGGGGGGDSRRTLAQAGLQDGATLHLLLKLTCDDMTTCVW